MSSLTSKQQTNRTRFHVARVTRLGEFYMAYFGQFSEIQKSTNYLDTFFHCQSYVLILTQNGLGYILGAFSQTHLVTLDVVNHVSVYIDP
jgi:hypothetical protein